ncbi:sensor histidine kinase [Sphingomonas xinjiangensis]|uniref:histidine kinase n=1 Tax=Sphingomonas xinjiangensis TaxID=643568 RepID=A0A840YG34_9SPHN|nr:sensor histidine kinase [Sphingomonas xinjiangensis]MBB5711794.1 two-component sensor histidine kinase [Sphingomonas xinjiangensis]
MEALSRPEFEEPEWNETQLRLAIESAGVALWSWSVEDDCLLMDRRGYALWDLPNGRSVTFAKLSENIHPADADRVRAAFAGTRAVPGSYEIDFRIKLGDEVRWISARGKGAEEGMSNGTMFGIFLDVTDRKLAQEGSELLAGEMSHRVKNLLAIAGGLTHLSSRSASSAKEMAGELTKRLSALGRAHDLVRPLPGEQGTAALLGDLLAVLLAPYDDTAAFSGRIRVAVPRMGVGEAAATTLAMVVHELATNSVKHGALSSDSGSLDISSRCDGDDLKLIWAETGGPEIGDEPQMNGFGSKLISRSMANQFSGDLRYEWKPSGLVATLRMRMDQLAA